LRCMKMGPAGENAQTQYSLDWDPNKARANLTKHGIGFEEAATVFYDPRMLTIYDDEHSKTEDRWVTLGTSAAGRVLVVRHTFREQSGKSATIRIYSSRRATKRERRRYEA
jgi:uncharacterized DUF497 family protein